MELYPILSTHNKHERDQNISFQEEGHKYTIFNDPESTYTSTTTWIHSHFPHFDADEVIQRMMNGRNWNPDNKYWGMTKEEIKKQWEDNGTAVSQAGTQMHFNIECFMNNNTTPYPYTHTDLLIANGLKEHPPHQTPEWKFFLKYAHDHHTMKPYRTEWTVYDEDVKLTGSIDMVYENPDGTLSIYDWKRSKDITRVNAYRKYAITPCISQMPDSNFWHYALQLNTYKAILERKYGKKVTYMCLVRLHPDNPEQTYELIPIPDLSNDIAELFALRITT